MKRTEVSAGRCRGWLRLVGLTGVLVFAPALAGMPTGPAFSGDEDTCLVVSAENIVTGKGNFYLYLEISDTPYTFKKDDQLEYDILLPSLNPVLKGGVDADLEGGAGVSPAATCIRDCGIRDQSGILLHGNGILQPARDRWYHRRFDLSKLAGCTAEGWTIVFEGDEPGRYVQFLDNIRVTRGGKPVFSVYEDGPAPEIKLRMDSGYSREVLITTAPRDGTVEDPTVAVVLTKARRENELRAARDQFRAELDVGGELAKLLHDERLQAEVDKAAAVEKATAFDLEHPEAYLAALRRARQPLLRFQPALERFTGHLVGHAHIDLQWLWSWDETVNQIIPDTFGQAIKFMQEFPELTFSQSSAALYLAAEQHHPGLFKQIQEHEKKGQWEIVGGRWCEGDLNMISPESHVRHFLYGQRYFQRKFGHICTDAWEPDTFGHPWTMPQILRKAGIRSYYFCRAGKKLPLFWWEGPDGSRVLAFEEPPTGGWYIDVVNDDKVRELAKFVRTTGAPDHLMVYGVGNHGGGPTRENIEAALAMKGRQPWPTIKFSRLTDFFDRLYEEVDRLEIPTVRDELNPVFEGCYTTHSRIKRYNRDSESLLEGAEVFASLASLCATGGSSASAGFAYPRETFESLWRDVLWNHHHDTLPGSFIHASSLYSAKMYDALIERGTEILRRSQRTLIERINIKGDKPHVIVFNPLAWTRSEVVDATLHVPVTTRFTTLYDADGDVPTQIVDRRLEGDQVVLRIAFPARSVPGCAFKVFRNRGSALATPDPVTAETLDAVYPTTRDKFFVVPPPAEATAHFQVLWEKPHGMSAWTIGEYTDTVDPGPVMEKLQVLENGEVRRRVRTVYQYDKSTITQDTITYPNSSRVDYETTVNWRQLGNSSDGGPVLKVAFDTDLSADVATYEIPFGDISRKNDGHENVALKWCDLTGGTGVLPVNAGSGGGGTGVSPVKARSRLHGITVLNDCKHAYDVKDGVIRLTLLRSSYEPDPAPDVGTHYMRYAVVPHRGPLDKAAAARAAWEFNKPLQVLIVESQGRAGVSPTEGLGTAWSGCQVDPANVIMTCMKRAEDNDDFIIRAYECAGKRTNATFALGFDARSVVETDLLERNMNQAGRLRIAGRTIKAEFKPYEIRTFRVRPSVWRP
ncbi:MAG: alpha-mannosidase [Phycisphaerae bacterium]